jgi:hypothetical protein
MKDFIRGMVGCAVFLAVCGIAGMFYYGGVLIVALVGVHFSPRIAIVLLPFCYAIPLLLIIAAAYLLVKDCRRSKR